MNGEHAGVAAAPGAGLAGFAPQARRWELSRYQAYQARLAGHEVARTFTRCTRFLAHAAGRADGDDAPAEAG